MDLLMNPLTLLRRHPAPTEVAEPELELPAFLRRTPHLRPMVWTVAPPTKPGWYWCRFAGSPESREVVRVDAAFDYFRGDIEWSSAPVPEPWG